MGGEEEGRSAGEGEGEGEGEGVREGDGESSWDAIGSLLDAFRMKEGREVEGRDGCNVFRNCVLVAESSNLASSISRGGRGSEEGGLAESGREGGDAEGAGDRFSDDSEEDECCERWGEEGSGGLELGFRARVGTEGG